MNQKKNQEKTKFSRLRLRSAPSVSKKHVSPKDPREKISSYFSSSLNEAASQKDLEETFLSNIESQYGQKFSTEMNSVNPKDVLDKKTATDEAKLNLDDSRIDDNDFAEPKIIKPAKMFEIKPKKVKRKRTTNNNDVARFIKDFGASCSDTNQEHLHLALAMSKSLEEAENPGQNNGSQGSSEYESPYPSTQQKIATIKSTLDQFGFKTNRSPVEISTIKNPAILKTYKFKTPTIFLRTEEDRAKLIETKVSRIFDNIAVYNNNLEQNETTVNNKDEFGSNKPKSFLLREYYDENTTIFRKNHLDLIEMNESTFYNNTVPREAIKSGILLKDWGSIPGRERSPPLPVNIIVDETEESSEKQENRKQNTVELCVNTTIDRGISPDLFSDSDTELSTKTSLNHLQKSPINKNIFTNSSRSPIRTCNSKTSPILLLSSSTSNKTTPVLSEKEIFSDDSDAKSLSLLDNISPRRNKNKSPKKNTNSPFKKSLFGPDKSNSVILLDIEGVTPLKNNDNVWSNSNSSPFVTQQNQSQIFHYESFCDNSNDYFDLTQSSDDSNVATVSNTPINNTNCVDEPISENLFASESIATEMGAHDDNYSSVIQIRKELTPPEENEELIDLTQSSNEFISNKTLILNEDSNDSIKTVLLQNKNNSSAIIEDTEEIDTVPLQSKVLDLKSKFEEDYSPEFDLLNPSNNKDFYKSLSFISDSESDADKSPKKNILKSRESSPNKTAFLKPKSVNRSSNKNEKSPPKLLRRSFSENIIGDKEINFVSQIADQTDFFKLSSPLNITKFSSQPVCYKNSFLIDKSANNRIIDEIEISDEELNYSVSKCNKNNEIVELNYSIKTARIEDINKPSCSKNIDSNYDDDVQFLSQSSTCSDISDEELNYSTNISFKKRKINKEIDEIRNTQEEFKTVPVPDYFDFNDLPDIGFELNRTSPNANESIEQSEVLKHSRVTDLRTPTKFNKSISLPNIPEKPLNHLTSTPNTKEDVKTPENAKINPNSNYIIKTTNVTPMPNYKEMSTPEIVNELDKFGVKALKRAKGIKLLEHIYNATHPILQSSEKVRESSSSDEEQNRIIKRRKHNSAPTIIKKRLSDHFENIETVECLGNEIANSENMENMIFERTQSAKIASCRVPLHIAWHNLMSSNQDLHEKVLLYEPIQVEEICAKFKSFGYKFHIQDIISFLDKKCITIRLAQKNHHKKKSKS